MYGERSITSDVTPSIRQIDGSDTRKRDKAASITATFDDAETVKLFDRHAGGKDVGVARLLNASRRTTSVAE